MNLLFHKYQGTGNDFIIVDNRDLLFPKTNSEFIASMCNRRLGIGSDGLILLEDDEKSDFKMIYYNSDGKKGTLCGNGGRCVVAFAKKLKLFSKTTKFKAIDGYHKAEINSELVSLQMKDVSEVKVFKNSIFADTGSPHHIEMVPHLESIAVVEEGRRIKNALYDPLGCNINFVEQLDGQTFKVRTYERGVEEETLSCGTGVTAVAISMHALGKSSSKKVALLTRGGKLEVSFDKNDDSYHNIVLSGPAKFIFQGNFQVL